MTSLRKATPADHAALAGMRRDAALMAALMIDPAEAAAEPVADWIARREAQGHFRVVTDTTDRAVGFVQLAGQHRRNATAWLGIAIAAQEQAKGHGGRALAALCALSTDLGLRKLKLEVRADNTAAIALYRAHGFREVGRLEAEFDDGAQKHDTLIMEHLL